MSFVYSLFQTWTRWKDVCPYIINIYLLYRTHALSGAYRNKRILSYKRISCSCHGSLLLSAYCLQARIRPWPGPSTLNSHIRAELLDPIHHHQTAESILGSFELQCPSYGVVCSTSYFASLNKARLKRTYGHAPSNDTRLRAFLAPGAFMYSSLSAALYLAQLAYKPTFVSCWDIHVGASAY